MPVRVLLALLAGLSLLGAIVLVPVVGVLIAGLGLVALRARRQPRRQPAGPSAGRACLTAAFEGRSEAFRPRPAPPDRRTVRLDPGIATAAFAGLTLLLLAGTVLGGTPAPAPREG